MSRFLTRVTRPDGTDSEMAVEAESVASAVEQIVAQKLHITSLVQIDASPLVEEGVAIHDRVTLFARGLGDLMRTGIPLPVAIRALAQDVGSRRFAKALETVASSVEAGRPLSAALRESPYRFPPLLLDLTTAGEKTGRLPDLMPILARHLNLRAILQRRLFDALMYPAVAVVFASVLLLLYRAVVFPAYATLWSITNMAQPALTRWSMILMENLPLVLFGGLGVILALVVIVSFSTRLPRLRGLRDRVLGWIPVIGRFRRSAHVSAFFHSTGLLIRGGVSIPDSLDLSAGLIDHVPSGRAIARVREQCQAGAPLGEALARVEFFPRPACWIVSAGESRGRLPEALLEASAMYERDAEQRLVIVQTWLPSVAIVSVALALAGVMVVGIYLPLIGLLQGLSG